MYFTVFLGLCQAIDFPFFRKIVEEKKRGGRAERFPSVHRRANRV
jgi:hypothetical protein